jgi:hypothetical protein
MEAWNREQTSKFLEANLPPEHLALARNGIRAAPERLTHARYHFQEAKRLLTESIDSKLDAKSLHPFVVPASLEELNELKLCFTRVEANVIASAMAIHSSVESLANIVYFAFALYRGPLAFKNVSAKRVVAQLRGGDANARAVAASLEALLFDPSFVAVDAFVNTTKHRGFPEARVNINPPDRQGGYPVELGTFEYNGITYTELEIEAVLAPAYAVALRTLIAVGNSINAQCA